MLNYTFKLIILSSWCKFFFFFFNALLYVFWDTNLQSCQYFHDLATYPKEGCWNPETISPFGSNCLTSFVRMCNRDVGTFPMILEVIVLEQKFVCSYFLCEWSSGSMQRPRRLVSKTLCGRQDLHSLWYGFLLLLQGLDLSSTAFI